MFRKAVLAILTLVASTVVYADADTLVENYIVQASSVEIAREAVTDVGGKVAKGILA